MRILGKMSCNPMFAVGHFNFGIEYWFWADSLLLMANQV